MNKTSASPPRSRPQPLPSAASAAQAEIKTEWVEYSHGDVKLKGYLAYDDAIDRQAAGCAGDPSRARA